MWTGLTLRQVLPRERVGRLDHDAFVAQFERGPLHRFGGGHVVDDLTRHVGVAGDLRQAGPPLFERRVEQVDPVGMEQVEEVRPDVGLLRHRVLERDRCAVFVDAEHFTVEHGGVDRKPSHPFDHVRNPAGDLVEAARPHPDLVAGLVDLDPDAVELPLDRHPPHLADGVGHALAGRRQHR